MGQIVVCPLDAVPHVLEKTQARKIVSLLSNKNPLPDLPHVREEDWLVLRFNDIAQEQEGLVAPSEAHVAQLIAFAKEWDRKEPLLCQCWFGVSRSTAAAIVILAALDEQRPAHEIAQALRDAAPFATPNPLIIAHADKLLGRGGTLIEAVSRIGRGEETSCGVPFLLSLSKSISIN